MSYAKFLQPQPSRLVLWNRRLHRWIGIIFLVTVAANLTTMTFGNPPMWVVYAPLPPLFAMMISGLIMLVNHYRATVRPS